MPLYMCRKCGSVENTALGRYWQQQMDAHEAGRLFEPTCSECDAGKWHGMFQKKSAAGYLTDKSDRFICTPQEAESYFKHLGPFHPVTLPAPA